MLTVKVAASVHFEIRSIAVGGTRHISQSRAGEYHKSSHAATWQASDQGHFLANDEEKTLVACPIAKDITCALATTELP